MEAVATFGITPGIRPAKSMKLRDCVGSVSIVSVVTVDPISLELTSTTGASAVTTTVSSMPPSSIVMLSAASWPTRSWIPSRRAVRNEDRLKTTS